MTKGTWIAIAVGALVLFAAIIGWAGTRPVSPTADDIRVVPGTGTLSRSEARPDAAAPTTGPGATAPAQPAAELDLADAGALPAALAAQPRDAAWAPPAEAGLREAFADVPHLSRPVQVTCATTMCQMTGEVAPNVGPDNVNAAMLELQGRGMARATERDAFRDTAMQFTSGNDGRVTFSGWFVRTP